MPSVYELKPKFQQLLRPFTAALYRAGITANGVTIFAAVASVGYGLWLALLPGSRWPWLLLPTFLLLRREIGRAHV